MKKEEAVQLLIENLISEVFEDIEKNYKILLENNDPEATSDLSWIDRTLQRIYGSFGATVDNVQSSADEKTNYLASGFNENSAWAGATKIAAAILGGVDLYVKSPPTSVGLTIASGALYMFSGYNHYRASGAFDGDKKAYHMYSAYVFFIVGFFQFALGFAAALFGKTMAGKEFGRKANPARLIVHLMNFRRMANGAIRISDDLLEPIITRITRAYPDLDQGRLSLLVIDGDPYIRIGKSDALFFLNDGKINVRVPNNSQFKGSGELDVSIDGNNSSISELADSGSVQSDSVVTKTMQADDTTTVQTNVRLFDDLDIYDATDVQIKTSFGTGNAASDTIAIKEKIKNIVNRYNREVSSLVENQSKENIDTVIKNQDFAIQELMYYDNTTTSVIPQLWGLDTNQEAAFQAGISAIAKGMQESSVGGVRMSTQAFENAIDSRIAMARTKNSEGTFEATLNKQKQELVEKSRKARSSTSGTVSTVSPSQSNQAAEEGSVVISNKMEFLNASEKERKTYVYQTVIPRISKTIDKVEAEILPKVSTISVADKDGNIIGKSVLEVHQVDPGGYAVVSVTYQELSALRDKLEELSEEAAKLINVPGRAGMVKIGKDPDTGSRVILSVDSKKTDQVKKSLEVDGGKRLLDVIEEMDKVEKAIKESFKELTKLSEGFYIVDLKKFDIVPDNSTLSYSQIFNNALGVTGRKDLYYIRQILLEPSGGITFAQMFANAVYGTKWAAGIKLIGQMFALFSVGAEDPSGNNITWWDMEFTSKSDPAIIISKDNVTNKSVLHTVEISGGGSPSSILTNIVAKENQPPTNAEKEE